MNKDKATAVIYKDWSSMILDLEPAQAGELFQSIYKYWDGEKVSLTPALRPIFKFIIDQIEKNERSYEEAKQKRIEGRRRQLENTSNELKSLEVTSSNSKSLKSTVNVNVNDNVNVNVLSKDNYKKEILPNGSIKKETPSRFIPPTLEEVKQYIEEKQLSVNAERFVTFYESKGWFVGKNKMKNWRAAVRNWSTRDKEEQTSVDDIISNWNGGESLGNY